MRFKDTFPHMKEPISKIKDPIPRICSAISIADGKYFNLVSYYGGKYNQLENTLPYIAKVAKANNADTYIELFGGGGKCILNIDTISHKFEKVIYNELDKGLCCLFEVAMDTDSCKKMYDILKVQKCNRTLFDFCKQNINDDKLNMVERAYMTYVLCNLSYNGERSFYVEKDFENYYRSVERLLTAHEHLRNVTVSNMSAIELLKEHGRNPKVVKYLDPPYHPCSRAKTAQNVYQNEMSVENHKELVALLCQSRSWVMSGYDPAQYGCNDYMPLEKSGAQKVSIGKFNLYSGKCKQSKEEFIWYKI